MRIQVHHPERFYISTDTAGQQEGTRIGVSWLDLHGRDWGGEPLMVVPHADRGRWDPHLHGAVRRFRWVTAAAYRSATAQGWRGGATLLLSPPNAGVLGWFDRSRLVEALCVVQGARYDTTVWARAHGCVDLTTGQHYPHASPPDPAVERALRALQESVDGRALSTSRDVAKAVKVLHALAADGHPLRPADLEAWALANDWSLVGAHRLGVQAGNVAARYGRG